MRPPVGVSMASQREVQRSKTHVVNSVRWGTCGVLVLFRGSDQIGGARRFKLCRFLSSGCFWFEF